MKKAEKIIILIIVILIFLPMIWQAYMIFIKPKRLPEIEPINLAPNYEFPNVEEPNSKG